MFRKFDRETKKDFGGTRLRGNARERRPISVKRPMHLVLRSERATGPLSLRCFGREKKIKDIITRIARAKGVKVYRLANSGNHLHLIILPRSREAFSAFIRSLTGIIARLVLGAEKGRPGSEKFWDARPFTRILEWGRDFRAAADYVLKNTIETMGFMPYERKKRPKRKRKKGSTALWGKLLAPYGAPAGAFSK